MSNTKSSTSVSGYVMPPEWAAHDSVWMAWPSDANLWEENLKPAQDEFVALCEAIVDIDPASKAPRGENIDILVHPGIAGSAPEAKRRLGHLPVRFHEIPFGDIWLRDTAPLFLKNAKGELASLRFQFNGWGGKYSLPHDPEVSGEIAAKLGFKTMNLPWVSEGGSLEFDGEGSCLTSKQCLLNENRNPGLDQKSIELIIRESLGCEKVLWVGDGLLNDHTDGHIDTIARYVAPGLVLAMEAAGPQDPNAAIMNNIIRELESQTDAKGRKIKVGRIPSPGAIFDDEGELMPASYLNFYIGNSTVVVPTYGAPNDEAAVQAIGKYFPKHRTLGRSAMAILSGGGAFHCITQQQPTRGI